MTLLISYAVIALIVSFLCSVGEAVLLSVTPAYVAVMENRGRRAGERLRKLKENIDRPLAAILSLNTIAHTVGAVGVGAQAAIVFGEAHVGIASAILTLLILVLSEIIPKTIGAVYWRQLAPSAALMARGLILLLYPLVFLAEGITNLLSKGETPHVFSREEFKAMADLGEEQGELEAQEIRILKNLLRLGSVRARDVMTPLEVVMSFPVLSSIQEVVRNNPDIPFSRVPVYTDTPRYPVGFVLRDDILRAEAHDQHDDPISNFRRTLLKVPEDTLLLGLFDTLLEQREQIAATLDDDGDMTGLVTLEDVIETLLGSEIVDEVDPAVDMRELAREQREASEEEDEKS